MKIVLTSVEDSLHKAWTEFCGDLDFVEMYKGSILDVECDAVVSPANSFGFMDGGIDAVYMRHFGAEIQMRVRRQIFEYHHGELVIGQADIVETDDEKIPFLICAPTMRVPMKLGETINPYLAARAVLLLIKHDMFKSGSFQGEDISEHVKTVALPGLGTGVGGVGFNTCAHQVRVAINDVVLEEYRMPQSWADASEKHQLLYTDKIKRLQH